MIVPIADPADARLDDYRNVPDPDLLVGRGLFVAEGRQVVRLVLADRRFRVRSLLVAEATRDSLEDVLGNRPELPVYLAPRSFFAAITGYNLFRGCLAIVERPAAADWAELVAGAARAPRPTLLLLERVANADNVGGVFRNAAAFGAGGVLLDSRSCDPLYRKAIRVSSGHVLRVPFARLPAWPGEMEAIQKAGWILAALTPARTVLDPRRRAAPPLVDLHDLAARPRQATGIVLLVGGEGSGLSDGALRRADVHVRIPMVRDVDSLNLATATGIALYALAWAARSG